MLEILLIAVVGTIAAGLWDLKTTEVPDKLPYALIIIGLVYWIANWLITGNITPLIISLGVGTSLLAIGLLLYKKRQWGGADAWILAAIGYLVPVYNGLFIIPYLFNLMLVIIAYTVIYSLAVGLLHPSVFSFFLKDVLEKKTITLGIPAAVFVAVAFISFEVPRLYGMFSMPLIIFLMMLFWRYAYVVDKHVFRKKIPTSKLKPGDVLDEGEWIGLTPGEIAKIKHKKRFVTIKDGMRFVPVFPIALILTLLFGNLFFIMLF